MHTASTPATVDPATATASPSTRPVARAPARASRRELAVEDRDALERGLIGAQHDELGRAAQQLDQLDRELGAGARLAGARAPPGVRRHDGHDDAPGQQAARQHEGGERQVGGADGDRDGAGEQRDEGRRQATQKEVLQGVDVAHHAGEQVAPAVAFETSRHERFEPREEAHAQARQQAKGEVVQVRRSK